MTKPNVYAEIAVARAKDMPARLAFGLFICGVGWVLVGGTTPLLWFLAVVAGQLIDGVVGAPMRRRPERPVSAGRRAAYTASITLNATIWSAIAAVMWFEGGTAGKVFAVLSCCGSIINTALQMEHTPHGLGPVWAPHILYLLGMPVASAVLSPETDLLAMSVVAVGGAVFVMHGWMAIKRIRVSNLQMAEAVIAADRANAAKSDFLATISHEIRTPMNAVVAAGSLLRRTDMDEGQAAHVEMLSNASEVLLGLLNDVLDLSRIESGKLEVSLAPIDLVEKLSGAVELWRPKTTEAVALRLEPEGLPGRILTDPLRLQQIVSNLLSNATKFTAQGEIVVRGGQADTAAGPLVWIEVEDSGCGMDAETAARVFMSFEQGSTGVTREHGGTGLGLAISRRLAELMGGRLTVSSQAGRGSVFRLEFPLRAAEPEATVETSLSEAGLLDTTISVLLAEDHEVNQRIIRLMLEPLGMAVTTAVNGAEAVELAGVEAFDVILMDMQMPVMGGIEATTRIRGAGGPNARTPILALTANAMAEHRAQWAAVGVETFLTKPIAMEALLDHIAAAVWESRAAAERAAA
jgi:signal transduction histidine kinase/CheY-like chemotaxis protein